MEEQPLPNWPPKAYKNDDFLNSPDARKIRVLCEMTEPERRFSEEKVEDTIVLFGSARIRPREESEQRLRELEEQLKKKGELTPEDNLRLRGARANVRAAPYYQAAVDLSRELTEWSMGLRNSQRRFIICSGGGPGIMEAANRGAKEAGGSSIGLGISLPFEQTLNRYVSHNLRFEFHYFFVRKYWFVYLAKALIAMPGGFGTLDELFETLTLLQTRKITKRVPIVLFGSEFWNGLINFEQFIDWGMISPEDLELFRIIDTVQEARDYIVEYLTREHLEAHEEK